jgi:hypothetical protein
MKPSLVIALLAAAAIPAIALAQAEPAKPHFTRYDPDANHDGYLSRAEALAWADEQFKRLDANGDGKLTPGEHRERPHGEGWKGPRGEGGPPAGPPDQAAPPPPSAPGAAAQPDRPRWGWMRHRAMMRMGMAVTMREQALLDEYDRNHDGALSLAEYRAHAERMFDARDGNRDGKIKIPQRPQMGKWRGPDRGAGAPPPAPPQN